MADQKDGHALPFGHLLQAGGALTHLADTACGRVERFGVGGLDAIHNDHDGVGLVNVSQHRVQTRFGDEKQVVGAETHPLGAHFDLVDAFFARNVEDCAVLFGHQDSHLEQ